jgi:hypothetical protein
MNSIYTNFTGLFKDGSPLDFLATWQKAFEKASEKEKALFEETYSDKWFTYNTPQMSLTAQGIMGKYRLRFMASVIGNESPTPLRRADGFDAWTKEIPRVGHKFFMPADVYRKLMEVYENPRLNDAAKVRAIEKTLKMDMQDAYLGVKDVMDNIALQALSNYGVARFTTELNNPQGREFEVDYDMDPTNKLVAPLPFTDANLASGVNFILLMSQIISDFKQKGIEFGELLMSQDLYYKIRMSEPVRLMVHGNDRKAKNVTADQFNELLSSNEIPPITTVTRKMGIDKDGQRLSTTPWNPNFIALKPSGIIGEIQPSIEDSELLPEKDVTYFNAGNGIRIAKWVTGESTNQKSGETTQGSGRLLPIITEINAIVSMQVRGFEAKVLPDGANYFTKDQYDAALAAG